MKRSRWWLVIAFVLFGMAAWLMRTKSPTPPRKPHGESEFPRYLRARESQRLAKREVNFGAPPDAGPSAMPRRRDPFLAAFPPRGPGKTAIVVEAGAMKAMPVGRMFLRCLKHDGEDERIQKKIGVSPENVERIGMSDDVQIIEGDFKSLNWDGVFPGAKPEPYGPHANIYDQRQVDDGPGMVVADYEDRILVFGKRRDAVEAALDRIDGQEAPGEAAVADNDAYGEVYGTVGVDRIAKILERDQPDLAERLRDAADRVELHVDATGDVLMVADVSGPGGASLGDLGKTMGGALSVGRMQAKASEDDKLADLLETAHVKPRDDSFQVEVGLPLDLIEKELGPCAKGWDAP